MRTVQLEVPSWLASIVDAVGADDFAGRAAAVVGALALLWLVRLLYHPSVPRVRVVLKADEMADVLPTEAEPKRPSGAQPCYDKGTGQFLGHELLEGEAEVAARIERARVAQAAWKGSSFSQRRLLLRTIARCVLEHADDICRISARDSGKTTTDAAFGEVLVTLEKLHWLCSEGEAALAP